VFTLEFARSLPERPWRGRFACPAYNVNAVDIHESDISRTFNPHSENARAVVATYIDDSISPNKNGRSAVE